MFYFELTDIIYTSGVKEMNLKINKRALIASVKNKKADKENVTFRLETDLYEKFREVCEKEGVKPSAIIEEFMKEFAKSK